MVTKTREKLIEVARQLFAHKGIENTTMNDIANASDKGRRTLYTYFRNKREIYNAVIERDSEQLVATLREVVEMELNPVDKLRKYLMTRFDIVAETVKRSEYSLKSFLTGDFRRVERIHRLAVEKEQALFVRLINEGVAAGCFDPAMTHLLPSVETVIFQGVDYIYVTNNFNDIHLTSDSMKHSVVEFLVNGIVKRT